MTNHDRPFVPLQLEVDVSIESADDHDVDSATRMLLAELQEIPSLRILTSHVAPPANAKAADAVTIGQLALVLASGGLLSTVVSAIRDWMLRDRRRAVRIRIGDNELDLQNATDHERQRIIDVFASQNDLTGR
jgi:hypothetical protein